jgi:glutathione S-transferase
LTQPVKIIGSYLSPYVRKVLVFLHAKKIAYEIDPIIPFFGDDRFTAISPVRRIPVLIDDRATLCDASVICQYLEERHPEPALFPRDVAERARARWLEEYADTRMGDVFIWKLFNQRVINPVARWPKTAAFVDRVLGREAFTQLAVFEDRMLRTPIPQQRATLAEMGAPILAETYGTSTPKRGVMPI